MGRFDKIRIRGFTLVEVLFVSLAMSLLLIALVNITRSGMRSYSLGIEQAKMKDELRRSTYRIATDVRQAVPKTGISGWISPSRADDALDPVGTLEFDRYRTDPAHSSDPEEYDPVTMRVKYEFVENPVGSGLYDLKRTQDLSGDVTVSIVGKDLKYDATDLESGSYFKWGADNLDISTTKANYNILEIKLVCSKYVGEGRKDSIELSSNIALRSSKTDGTDVFRKISNYMDSPTSLVDPR